MAMKLGRKPLYGETMAAMLHVRVKSQEKQDFIKLSEASGFAHYGDLLRELVLDALRNAER